MNFIKSHLGVILPITATVLTLAVAVTVLLVIKPWAPVEEVSSSAPSSSSEVSEESSSEDESSEDQASSLPEVPEIELAVTVPASTDVTVNTPYYTIKGSYDPAYPITLNGVELDVDGSGLLAHSVELAAGANYYTITHKDKTVSFVIRYKKVVIKSVSPASDLRVESLAQFAVSCTALKDSTVTATWNGKTVTLYPDDNEDGATEGEYQTYLGGFTAPTNTGAAKSYGKVSFTATSPYGTGSETGGTVTVNKFDPAKFDGGNGYPQGCGYLNVGSTYVIEVISDTAETFNGDDVTDLSRPTNCYLPKGTVDYCSPYTKTFTSSGQSLELFTLRYGKQLYKQTINSGVNTKVYEGSLPDTNKVALASLEIRGNKTVMTFDVDWKAPFKFDILPQTYRNTSASNRDYSVKEITFEYIDITFCYADTLEIVDIPANNPIFSRAEVIEGDYDRVLRLHLKKKGAFYGWWSEYNDEGQLEFSFLNPAIIKEADNEYGYSLEGITVAIDPGHGGNDLGALGFTAGIHEAQLNLKLALELERELTALGATVVMTRTEDVNPTALQRINTVVNSGADIAVSVHRNAANRTSANGFDAYHFNPFTAEAARHLLEATLKTGVYKVPQSPMEKWHVFFLSRVTACPVVLTENGFVSNAEDYYNMLDDRKTTLCAKALAQGIVNYFAAMQ